MNSPLSKIPDRFQAPVKAAFRALTAPADLSDEAVMLQSEAGPAASDGLMQRMRRPMVIGALVVLLFVVIAGVWASFAQIEGSVTAPGLVRAEFNRRTLRPRDGGIVAAIHVQDGQLVKAGQVLLELTPTQPRASVDVSRNQVDAGRVQAARFEAEMTGKASIVYPPDMVARAATDPALASLMRDQELVFRSRRALINDQRIVFRQQIEQLKARIGGLNLQIAANEQSAAILREQLKGYQSLYDKGFAPRTTLLNLQRSLSDLGGQRGANLAEVSRTQEQIGEVTANLAKLDQQTQTEAAESLRDTQVRLADALPRLAVAEEALSGATVRAPIDGYVFGLTQHTVGAALGAGERIMDIVPVNEPLIVEANLLPTDIDAATIGQKARVTLTAYNSRTHQGVEGEVVGISPDLVVTEAGNAYFRVSVRVRPEDLIASDNKDVKLTPGMPASVMLLTGKRSIMSYLLGPFTAPIAKAMREE